MEDSLLALHMPQAPRHAPDLLFMDRFWGTLKPIQKVLEDANNTFDYTLLVLESLLGLAFLALSQTGRPTSSQPLHTPQPAPSIRDLPHRQCNAVTAK